MRSRDKTILIVLALAALATAAAWAFLRSSPASVQYRNEEFGLLVRLPETWEGFTVVMESWEARSITDDEVVASGPVIMLRHPQWTAQVPRQDVPIMLFTDGQWRHVGAPDGDWSVGAAPIPPSPLASNSRFVFALPARYNYAFPEGWQEVDALIQGGAVSAFEPDRADERARKGVL